jgi:hypothetical protein
MDIPDVSEDGFEGHFKVTYAGDGSITLQTKVQVQPGGTSGVRASWWSDACVGLAHHR